MKPAWKPQARAERETFEAKQERLKIKKEKRTLKALKLIKDGKQKIL